MSSANDQAKERQIASISHYFPSTKEIKKGVEYHVSCSLFGTIITTRILLPPGFPSEPPTLYLDPPMRHRRVDDRMQVIGFDNLTKQKWTPLTSVPKIIQDILKDLQDNPPQFLGPSPTQFPPSSQFVPNPYYPVHGSPSYGGYPAPTTSQPPYPGPSPNPPYSGPSSYQSLPYPARPPTGPSVYSPPQYSGPSSLPNPYHPPNPYGPPPSSQPLPPNHNPYGVPTSTSAPPVSRPLTSSTPVYPPPSSYPNSAPSTHVPARPAPPPPSMPSNPAPNGISTVHVMSQPVLPTIPDNYPEIDSLSNEQLQALVDPKSAEFFAFFSGLSIVKSMEKEHERREQENVDLARKNLALKSRYDEMSAVIKELDKQRREQAEIIVSLRMKQDELMAKFAPARLREALEIAARDAETQSDDICEQFEAGKMSLDAFRTEYIEKKKLHFIRQLKANELRKMTI